MQLVDALLREADTTSRHEHVVDVAQLEGGWSRLSYVADVKGDGNFKRFVVRVKPEGGFLQTDLSVEYEILRALTSLDLPTPRPVSFYAPERNPFGGPFFIMEYLEGEAFNVWRDLDRQRLEAYWYSGDYSLATDIVTYLARIHEVSEAAVPEGIPRTTFAQHRRRWQQEYDASGLCRDPVIEEAFVWLEENEPERLELGLVHGDYRVGNVLVDQGRVSGILDWELAHVGDTRYDLGYISLPYMAGKHLRPKTSLLGGIADKEWFLSEYARRSNRDVIAQDVIPFSLLSAVSLAVMAHVGVRHYMEGRTTDIRRAWARYSLPGLRQDMISLMDW
jgi:aminoglycoside phosphotransferase (APT) family kinase protein